MANLTAVILAAGKGTRMKSKLPKVLHKVGGHPMLEHVMDAAEAAGCRDNVVVIGHGAELVRELVGDRARIALQAEQLGTGHAVLQAADTLKDFTGTVMILCGDTPLLEAEELEKFYAEHVKSGAAATVMSSRSRSKRSIPGTIVWKRRCCLKCCGRWATITPRVSII